LFADCDEHIAQSAIRRLRPQALSPYIKAFPLDEFPPAPSSYVVCSQDRLVNPEWSRRVACDRLSADLIELPGSHSPFLSRPSAVADVLLRIADAN
jgi:hypothetical protein